MPFLRAFLIFLRFCGQALALKGVGRKRERSPRARVCRDSDVRDHWRVLLAGPPWRSNPFTSWKERRIALQTFEIVAPWLSTSTLSRRVHGFDFDDHVIRHEVHDVGSWGIMACDRATVTYRSLKDEGLGE